MKKRTKQPQRGSVAEAQVMEKDETRGLLFCKSDVAPNENVAPNDGAD
jgi:hypothetical protein